MDLPLRAGGPLVRRSARWTGRRWTVLASLALHGLAVVAAVLAVSSDAVPPEPETPVEMVFEQPSEAAVEPPAEMAPTPGPLPPAAMPEPPPPEPPPPPAAVPEPPPPVSPLPPPPEPPPPADAVPEPPPPVSPPPAPVPAPLPPPPPPVPRPPPPPKYRPPVPAARPAAAKPVAPAPAAAPPAPAATPPAPAVDPSWRTAVFGWLASHKTYPDDARRRGDEGAVAIRFTIDRSGHVLDAAVTASSGSARLDEAALALLRGAVLPGFPAAMTQSRITIVTTLRYSLR